MVFLTVAAVSLPAQADQAELARLTREARSGDAARRLAAWDTLLSLGKPGAQILTKVLVQRDRELKDRLGRLIGAAPFQALKGEVEKRLQGYRKEATVYIFNEALFRKGFGIKGMEERVSRVRRLWERPEEVFFPKVAGLEAALQEAGELARYGESLGLKELAAPAALERVRQAIGVRRMGISDGQHRWNRAVLKWNAEACPTSANAEEEKVVLLTNEYRIMMGRRALELDERILRAARAHSQEMEDRNYFSHTSPVKDHADFGTRLRLKGYSGPLNENIAVAGSAARAFTGWYLSAGHHRNMLSTRGTAIAVGRSKGRGAMFKWTMNLGAGDTLRGRKLSDPSLQYLAKRRATLDGTAASHLALARWCRDKMLIKEMSRECREALKKNPRLREARLLLAERFKLMKRK